MITEEQIAYLFAKNGFRLSGVEKVSTDNLTLEESIALVLRNDKRYNPRLVEGIPLFFAGCKVSEEKILKSAAKYNVWNQLGYMLTFVVEILDLKEYQTLLDEAEKNMAAEIQNMSGISGLHDWFIKFQKPEEKKWNVIGAPSYDSMLKKIVTYGKTQRV